MKRHNIIVFLFFLVFGTIEGGISAQPYIRWNAITWQSTKSLVQDWRTGNAIGYMEDPTGDGYFFLKGNGILVTRAAFPSGITVNDFRINNDSVFFCGVDNTSSHGIVGFFDIASLFAGTGSFNYSTLNTSVSTPTSLHFDPYPKRMDLFTFGGSTHIAFVGDMLITNSSSGTTATSTIGCAYWDGTNWNMDFHINSVGNLKYTDIAASCSYVAAVATNGSPDYLVQVFKLSNDFVTTPLNFGNVFQVSSFAPLGDILLDDISATDFVLAYHYNDGGVPCTKLQQFRVIPATMTIALQLTLLTPLGMASPHYSSSGAMKRLCYDNSVPRILLLQDAITTTVPSVESSIFSYTPSGIATGHVDVSYFPGTVLDRMDVKTTGGYWATGNEGGLLSIASENIPSIPATPCHEGYQLDCDIVTETLTIRNYSFTANPFLRSTTTKATSLEYEELLVRCEE
ncbi:MAG: hypothetical protein IKN11_09290 [Bacteroidales bacterium]|nr:hypothetical protein [Bacteroidales bacterium]